MIRSAKGCRGRRACDIPVLIPPLELFTFAAWGIAGRAVSELNDKNQSEDNHCCAQWQFRSASTHSTQRVTVLRCAKDTRADQLRKSPSQRYVRCRSSSKDGSIQNKDVRFRARQRRQASTLRPRPRNHEIALRACAKLEHQLHLRLPALSDSATDIPSDVPAFRVLSDRTGARAEFATRRFQTPTRWKSCTERRTPDRRFRLRSARS